jgi:hypothetical protein
VSVVLGVNPYHGDAADVLLRDVDVVAAFAEERRIEHWAGVPAEPIGPIIGIEGRRSSLRHAGVEA